uniref:Uncharacterized protein n=1 Tax=viral metagenome TaxID=1070528 RepID=A0A6C0C9I9_9ZZZZ
MDIITFRQEYGTILVGAIVFIASFLWKDFLGDFEDMYFPKQHGLWRRFLFVTMITVVLVTIAVYLKRVLGLSSTTDIHFDSAPENETDSIEEFKNRQKKLKCEFLR